MATHGDGRRLGFDDLGDPEGTPVVYLHGTPDSRLARHPDDGLAARVGVRLLAVDRPGYGDSSPPAGPSAAAMSAGGLAAADALEQFAADLSGLLDALGVGPVALLAWSGGAPPALSVAHRLGRRVERLAVVAGLVPRDAYDDPAVRDAAPGRADLFDLADDLPVDQLGEMVAPMLAPYPCEQALAEEHQREQRNPGDQAAVDTIPGAAAQLGAGLAAAVRSGLEGVALDVVIQNTRGAVTPAAEVECPVDVWYGLDDQVTPPAFGHWFHSQFPKSDLHLVDDAGHMLLLTHWSRILSSLRA